MVNKGFPSFGTTQDGVNISTLKNYSLSDFILKMIAAECDSDLLEKGRMDARLQSMNEQALRTLYRIFVNCDDDSEGRFAQYRFYAYVSSMFNKCEMLIDETIPGQSQKNHKFPVAVRRHGVYVAVAYNKAVGNPVSTREVRRFYDIVHDVKRGEHGTMLSEAAYVSSVGIKNEAIAEIRAMSSAQADESKVGFRVVSFESGIYSVAFASEA